MLADPLLSNVPGQVRNFQTPEAAYYAFLTGLYNC
jgi:hypothetical protein